MNIYKTDSYGDYEATMSIELDCEKPSEVAFARELLTDLPIPHPCEVCDPENDPACTEECQEDCLECVTAEVPIKVSVEVDWGTVTAKEAVADDG